MPFPITVTQSNVLSAKPHHLTLNPILILNIVLLALCASFVFYYVVRSNVLAANDYKVSSLRNELAQITASNGGMLAEKSTNDDPAAITAYSQAHGMVPANNVAYIFADGRVALH